MGSSVFLEKKNKKNMKRRCEQKCELFLMSIHIDMLTFYFVVYSQKSLPSFPNPFVGRSIVQSKLASCATSIILPMVAHQEDLKLIFYKIQDTLSNRFSSWGTKRIIHNENCNTNDCQSSYFELLLCPPSPYITNMWLFNDREKHRYANVLL